MSFFKYKRFNVFDNLEIFVSKNEIDFFPFHFHNMICLSLITEGTERLQTREEVFFAPQGSISVIQFNEVHQNSSLSSSGYSYKTIYLNPDILSFFNAGRKIDLLERVIYDPLLFSSLEKLIDEQENSLEAWGKAFTHLTKYRVTSEKELIKASSFIDIEEIIENELIKALNTDWLASKFCLSKYHFIREFKKTKGLTPQAYIMLKRLEKAKEMLYNGVALGDVSFMNGFYDDSHFIKCFKKIFWNYSSGLSKTAIIYHALVCFSATLAVVKTHRMVKNIHLLIVFYGTILLFTSCSFKYTRNWESNNSPGKYKASFHKFTGKETNTISGKKGDTMQLSIATKLNKGSLNVLVRNRGKTLLKKQYAGNSKQEFLLPVLKDGDCKIIIEGISASGEFNIEYQVNQQSSVDISNKVEIGYNNNVETYFIAERLVAENIGSYVFSNKSFDYSHQPLVTAAFNRFKGWKDSLCIQQISVLMKQLKPVLGDNTPIVDVLLRKKNFPEIGNKYSSIDSSFLNHQKSAALIEQVVANLQIFYLKANVAQFLHENTAFYQGAVAEVEKDINRNTYNNMEEYFGESFVKYHILVTPTMPLPAGEDNYRGIGATIKTRGGKEAFMLMSSNVMLPKKNKVSEYTTYAFDNKRITHFLAVHEVAHSFINPHLAPFRNIIQKDSNLFTPVLASYMAPQGVANWNICVTEHLVRLSEIRIAETMGNTIQANRLRKMHMEEFKFILLPELEEKNKTYETNRNQFKSFKEFLPELLSVFKDFTGEEIDKRLVSLKK